MWLVYALLLVECFVTSIALTELNTTAQLNGNIGLIIVLINSIALIFALYRMVRGDKTLFVILIWSFGIRMLLLLMDLYGKNIFVLPGSGNDTEMFHHTALMFPNFSMTDNPYGFFVGSIYNIASDQRIVAQYVNLLFSISTIGISIKIFDEFNIGYKVKVLVVSVLSFIPNYMILSVILLRESIMIFLLAISLLSFVKWWKYNRVLYFVFSMVFVLLASIFHSGVIANAVGYIIVFILCNNKEREFKLNFNSFLATCTFMIVFIVFFNGYSDIFMSKFGNVEDVNDVTNRTALAESGGASYQVGGEVNSFSDMIVNSPIRMFYFITSPLPWNWRGLNDIIAFVFSALFYFVSYVYAVRALRVSTKNSNKSFIIVGLLLAILSAFIFAWGVSNAGTAIRHRDKFIVNYIVMLGLSLNVIKSIKKSNKDN